MGKIPISNRIDVLLKGSVLLISGARLSIA